MATPATQQTGTHFLVRPGVFIFGGGLAVAGAVLAWLAHPAWGLLAILGGLALILTPDPASDSTHD